MNKLDRLVDSYRHYRKHVGLKPWHAVYRAVYYEVMKRDPKKYIYILPLNAAYQEQRQQILGG